MHTGRTARRVMAVAAMAAPATAAPGLGVMEAKNPLGAATVTACVWHDHKPTQPYTIDWHPGGADDRCMLTRLAGAADTTMTVADRGLTCRDVGMVAVDTTGLCRLLASRWSLSYTASSASGSALLYSGSTSSRWTTRQRHTKNYISEITLGDASSPGTSVCPSGYHCPNTSVQWDSEVAAYLHIVFQPDVVDDPGRSSFQEEDGDDDQEPHPIEQMVEVEL